MKKNTSTTTQCPEWCIDPHDWTNPLDDGWHRAAEQSLNHVFNQGIGNGIATASITQQLADSKQIFNLYINVEDEIDIQDAEETALQFERLAASIRGFATDVSISDVSCQQSQICSPTTVEGDSNV